MQNDDYIFILYSYLMRKFTNFDLAIKDNARLDIMQEVGKICYYMRDYASAYHYYKRFLEIKEAQNLDIYRYENDKIEVVLSKMGLIEESEKYFNDFKDYTENDISINRHLNLSMLYSYRGDTKRAIEQLELFLQQNNYDYWVTVFLKMDPLIDNIKDLPEFKKILSDIEIKFWNSHKQIKASLEEKELL
ncbi:hypothetical protein ES705_32164 [subsurface metagenome]